MYSRIGVRCGRRRFRNESSRYGVLSAVVNVCKGNARDRGRQKWIQGDCVRERNEHNII